MSTERVHSDGETGAAGMNELARITKACGACGKPLVVRTNSQNGSQFLGCTGYPTCRETEPLPLYVELRRAGATPLPGFE